MAELYLRQHFFQIVLIYIFFPVEISDCQLKTHTPWFMQKRNHR